MKVSRVLAHKLLNLIQMVMGYIETKREKEAIKKLQEMARLIENQTVGNVNCEDCDYQPRKGKP